MQNKAKRVKKAATRKLRKVSGWNIFQREKLKGLATSLEPSAYKAQVKALSREWKNAAQEDRAAYVVQAEYEHSIREKLVDKPLPAKGQAPLKEEAVVGSRALQKLAVCRLINNYKIAESHPIWTSDATMGCSSMPVLQQLFHAVLSPLKFRSVVGTCIYCRRSLIPSSQTKLTIKRSIRLNLRI